MSGLLVALLLCAAIPATAENSVQALLAGLDYLEIDRWTAAGERFATATRLNPDLPEPPLAQATLELLQGHLDVASKTFLAYTDGPCAGVANLGAADCFLQYGKFTQAQRRYQAALQSGLEQPVVARSGLAYAYCALGQYDKAMAEAEAVLAVEADEPLALETLAAANVALGNLDSARRLLEKAAHVIAERGITPIAKGTALQSPILRSDSAYYATTNWAERERWASAIPLTDTRRSKPAATGTKIAILSPAAGAMVNGHVPIRVRVPEKTHFLFLRVDGRLACISNTAPFAITYNAGALGTGPHDIAVEAYDARGSFLARAEAVVVVEKSATRTFAPETARMLRDARSRLERILRPLPQPLSARLLLGKVYERTGNELAALSEREYVFCAEPAYPSARADLLWSYNKLGLLGRADTEWVISGFPAGSRRIALTFDDGPHPTLTPRILDILDRFGVKATFFLIGKQAELYPDLVAEIHRRGHELGDHSYSHINLTDVPRLEVERELVKARAVIRDACGATVTLFRPPGGRYDQKVSSAARTVGFRTVLWTITISSYEDASPAQALAGILSKTRDGSILLFHNGRDRTVDVLESFLASVQREGLTPTTVSEMLQGS